MGFIQHLSGFREIDDSCYVQDPMRVSMRHYPARPYLLTCERSYTYSSTSIMKMGRLRIRDQLSKGTSYRKIHVSEELARSGVVVEVGQIMYVKAGFNAANEKRHLCRQNG